jgi:hypothetical protein
MYLYRTYILYIPEVIYQHQAKLVIEYKKLVNFHLGEMEAMPLERWRPSLGEMEA